MQRVLYHAICRILKPLVRILHRKGISFGEFSQISKQIYVEVSEEVLAASGERPTTSRIAIITGLTRKEVAQLRQTDDATPVFSSRYNRGVRVITGWLEDSDFQDGQNSPAMLPLLGEAGSFQELVSRYSGDMPYRAMLQELERVGAVQQDESGHVRLLSGGYIPHADEDEKLSILGTDVALLLGTIKHNIETSERQNLRFQRKVSYDNLPVEILDEFRAMVERDGMGVLLAFNTWLRQHDRDSNPAAEGTGRMRAGVGIYYFEEAVTETEHENKGETS